mmetsp:Transcript_6471/g.21710  ORF Transcript_6471/g.21710 Transcript_6471/m.21710 type:complete len:433 (+) Transcript_6471:4632-5930(+)
MSVQNDALLASVLNPSSSDSSPGFPAKPPPPPGLRFRAGCSNGSAITDSGSTSCPPSIPMSSSSTTTDNAGAAHHATPSKPAIAPAPTPTPPGRTPLAAAWPKDISPGLPEALLSDPDSDPESLPDSPPSRFGFFRAIGCNGNSTCMSISLNHPGEVVAWHTCVFACARPHRTTANGSDEPCASAAGKSFAWYTCTCNMYCAVGRGSMSSGGSSAASLMARASAFRRNASARFSAFAPAAFSTSSSSPSSSPSSSLAAARASFSSAATSAGDMVFASRFAFGEPWSIKRSSTLPIGRTCSARRLSPRLCPPIASACKLNHPLTFQTSVGSGSRIGAWHSLTGIKCFAGTRQYPIRLPPIVTSTNKSGAPSPLSGPSNGVGSLTRMGFSFRLYVAWHSFCNAPPSLRSVRDGDASFARPIVNSTPALRPTNRD